MSAEEARRPERKALRVPTAEERRFEAFLAEFDPDVAGLGREAVAHLRARLPTADVMIYDNYNFLVAGFSPNERPSNAVLSIAMNAAGVYLCFLQGARLPDPHSILRGSGKVARNIRLESIHDVRRFYVKSVSANKRPRRKQSK